jgi:hypothetical protein
LQVICLEEVSAEYVIDVHLCLCLVWLFRLS